MTRYTPDIEPIIREAGALLMSYFQRRIGYEYKGDVDLVTEADRASEKFITERLRAAGQTSASWAKKARESDLAAEYRWLVDPLDGTTNFAHGYPVFCISIALVRGEELIAGFLYDPTRDEFFSAEHGAGAKLNGQAMHVSKTQTLVGVAARHRLSQPQAAQESEYPLLSPAHAALARTAACRLGRARPGERRLRSL